MSTPKPDPQHDTIGLEVDPHAIEGDDGGR